MDDAAKAFLASVSEFADWLDACKCYTHSHQAKAGSLALRALKLSPQVRDKSLAEQVACIGRMLNRRLPVGEGNGWPPQLAARLRVALQSDGKTGAGDDKPGTVKRPGRAVSPEEIANREIVWGHWRFFVENYRDLGYSRLSKENFADWTTDCPDCDDMPTDDVVEMRRMIDAYRKAQICSEE